GFALRGFLNGFLQMILFLLVAFAERVHIIVAGLARLVEALSGVLAFIGDALFAVLLKLLEQLLIAFTNMIDRSGTTAGFGLQLAAIFLTQSFQFLFAFFFDGLFLFAVSGLEFAQFLVL